MGNRSWLVWPLAAWLLFASAALWLGHGSLALDTDSAMRLVQVRDLLAGRSAVSVGPGRRLELTKSPAPA